jgi:hypothetical protein
VVNGHGQLSTIGAEATLIKTERAGFDMATERTMAHAKILWATDTEVTRDREDYESFDDMPPGLQQWWFDRAVRKVSELRLLNESGYPT